MTKRLLVGIGEDGEMSPPRQDLIDLVAWLGTLGVETQVAAFADGPVIDALAEVADVRRLDDLRGRSVGRVAQGVAGRISPELAPRVQERRTEAGRDVLHEPDCIHIHGALGTPVLHYVTDTAPVTVAVHPWDFSIAGLAPKDRRLLVGRAERFLVADDTVVGPLLDAGVDRARIGPAPDPSTMYPDLPRPRTGRPVARRVLGLPVERAVVAIPPVAGWADMPDLTVGLAWELERLGGADAPVVLWYGMRFDADEQWFFDDDVRRAGVHDLRLLPQMLDWEDVVDIVDVIALPLVTSAELPEDAAELARQQTTPVVCWEGDPVADAVAAATGTVVARGDVEAMAAHIWSMVRDDEARQQARTPSWSSLVAEVERLVPIGIPAP